MPPRIPEKQLKRARAMRREQTIAEEMLWDSLRDRGLGVKFRRQVPVGPFVVDFACVEAKLVVEVDGPSHETDEGLADDTRRDAWLKANDWRVVRVSNALVTGGGELALDASVDDRAQLLLPLAGEGGPRVSEGRMRAMPDERDGDAASKRPAPSSDLASRGHLLPRCGRRSAVPASTLQMTSCLETLSCRKLGARFLLPHSAGEGGLRVSGGRMRAMPDGARWRRSQVTPSALIRSRFARPPSPTLWEKESAPSLQPSMREAGGERAAVRYAMIMVWRNTFYWAASDPQLGGHRSRPARRQRGASKQDFSRSARDGRHIHLMQRWIGMRGDKA